MSNRKSQLSDVDTAPAVASSESPIERAYVTPEEFVRLSGLSLSTVRRYLADGRLLKVQPGGPRCRVLIPRDTLESFLRRDPELETTAEAPLQVQVEDADSPSSNKSPRRRGPAPRWTGRR